ncbi:sugar ABC transporter permease [Streptomyces pluripotens]|uniref:Sugar ABC transporter permease n=1 Tax=Streptomyces pluripotens TaxID=1355015 RepID=A0A221NT97_9ACTN|nr:MULTISPECIES: sugar ABC transporter permease [Streptomyces]ARP68879.1 ABC transporter permease [Streptomyces pluripotens]ASN23132.1 sugar ABC transporter permease [Streptomyces pluripotens]KIE25848.1 ABC transporter permease [Streptomyces sp. MUSC 125]MCH0556862.1 sugar ABC transporter permease [Streptomyces sp. MUM 16J]
MTTPTTPARVRRQLPTSPWLFAAPGLLVTGAFVLYPFVSTLINSFTDRRTLLPGRFVGLANFRELLHDDMFWTGLRNSTLYIVGVVPALVVLPLLLALLVQKNIPGITFFRAAFYTPVVASIVVVGLIWVWLLDERGLINSLLESVGIGRVGFLSDQWLLLLSAMTVTVWKGLGYYMIIYLAALANVPRELHEAAAVDGAGPVRRFLSVTVPAVRSTMVLVAALSSVAAFKVFSEVYLMAGPSGGPAGEDTTLVMLVQRTGTGLTGRVGYASALSVVVFAVTVVLMLLVLRADRREEP